MILAKGSIVRFGAKGGTMKPLSEHNREPWNVDFERFETSNRMADATLRKWNVATKRTWSTSWTDLPHSDAKTVDQFMGGENMEKFYLANPFEFNMDVRNPDGSLERVVVSFKEFSRSVKKRGVYEFWDITLSVEEV